LFSLHSVRPTECVLWQIGDLTGGIDTAAVTVATDTYCSAV
jgi:hypothetical protein